MNTQNSRIDARIAQNRNLTQIYDRIFKQRQAAAEWPPVPKPYIRLFDELIIDQHKLASAGRSPVFLGADVSAQEGN